ncbi:MarR family winged helix-turn-helix transcriptional regulator [Candidatus Epulonipiscium viviparus]|uniref:MarR family winged helix-turn-helix transcriptional regulator n=1 Tax=Candidatus Epulonipiscium viviparus TaxID=420336 RepID=UPI00016C087F|nr:MarR family transcriptional regulator [Candidatus Epulopiscium viviparus]
MKDDRSINRYLSQIYRKSIRFLQCKLAEEDVGCGQFTFLEQIFKYEGISQEELSNKLVIDKTTTARAVKKLEDKGYVRREKRINDKRTYGIYVTERAIAEHENIINAFRDLDNVFNDALTVSEKDTLINLLAKICNHSQMK